MKPAPFAYEAATSVDFALAALQDDAARPLAGGQSLIPMMNFRLAFPERLVDLNPVAELAGIATAGGGLRIGAMTRQTALERSPAVAHGWPLLTAAVAHVGHRATRSRGTVGGSVAHADPAAELPVALTALDARFHVRGAAGDRVLTAGELFTGALTTALATGELLVAIEVPDPPPGARMGFAELARTHGDFALAGAAAVLGVGGAGIHASVALLGAGPVPVRAAAVERALGEGATAAEAAARAAGDIDDPYRRALLRAMTRRALERALHPAGETAAA
jgi:CO/xanthine dehydrogenase FAD-binding subunit